MSELSQLTFSSFIAGREYDKDGNLHQWWEGRAVDDFKGKAACFVTQYDNYGLNGHQTLGEYQFLITA
jgi:endothelin-converting enzyme